jgi:hypothetical protein
MDYTLKVRSLQSLVKDMNKGGIVLSHKLQRPEGQWNRKQKSDLIDSLLRHYPVNPTYGIIEENGVLSIIDGVQRLSTIRDYIEDKFALSKDMELITIDNEEKDLSGLKFSKLDEDTQNEILNLELQIYRISDCTENDIREIFRRQNAGKPLSPRHMRVVNESDYLNSEITKLIEHPFMYKVITPAMHKNGSDRDIIIQTMMLIFTNQDNDYTSFKSKDMNAFVIEHGDDIIEKFLVLTEALNKLNDAFDEEALKIPSTSLPMVLYSAYRIIKDKKSFARLTEKIRLFINEYDYNDYYKQFLQSGTSNQENVRGRLNYWKNIIREL